MPPPLCALLRTPVTPVPPTRHRDPNECDIVIKLSDVSKVHARLVATVAGTTVEARRRAGEPPLSRCAGERRSQCSLSAASSLQCAHLERRRVLWRRRCGSTTSPSPTRRARASTAPLSRSTAGGCSSRATWSPSTSASSASSLLRRRRRLTRRGRFKLLRCPRRRLRRQRLRWPRRRRRCALRKCFWRRRRGRRRRVQTEGYSPVQSNRRKCRLTAATRGLVVSLPRRRRATRRR